MQNYFVDIIPVYVSEHDRTIEKLSELYNNHEFLQKSISNLITKHFPPEIMKEKRILLKPNWVKQSINETDEICLRTHDNFLLATLEIVLKFKPASVLIGDAPIQGCKWDKVVTSDLLDKIHSLSKKHNIPVEIKDFRRVAFDPIANKTLKDRNPISDYLIFDLGKESYLEPITDSKKNVFRVTDYNPDQLAESHRPGVHKYCITKELFNADIIISLPKVKTHQKVGITAALKNLVGVNGDKDFLPHHRIGSSEHGGDCYPGNNFFRSSSEYALDFANRRQGKFLYLLTRKISGVLWRLSFPGHEHNLGAGWHGNDTTWRMVLDLNKIAIYGNVDGTLTKQPQRQLFSLCDGIIGGQGDGPLRPEPLALGVISLTNHSGMNDLAMATLMEFEIKKISMLNEVFKSCYKQAINLTWNNSNVKLSNLDNFSLKTNAPPGWVYFLMNK